MAAAPINGRFALRLHGGQSPGKGVGFWLRQGQEAFAGAWIRGGSIAGLYLRLKSYIQHPDIRCAPGEPAPIPNALDPDRMTADERLLEVCEILASGLIRLRARRHEQQAADAKDLSLDFTARQSVHGRTPRGRRKSHA